MLGRGLYGGADGHGLVHLLHGQLVTSLGPAHLLQRQTWTASSLLHSVDGVRYELLRYELTLLQQLGIAWVKLLALV